MTTNLKGLSLIIEKATTNNTISTTISNDRAQIVANLRSKNETIVTDDRGRRFQVTVVGNRNKP
jgi:hypothetical protein